MRHRVLATLIVVLSLGPAIGHPRAHQAAAPAPPGATVTVDARHAWIDSGILVHKGDRLAFTAEGTITWGQDPDEVAGPDGRGAKPGKVGTGGLIGRLGYTGKPFAVGSTRTVTVQKDGRLFTPYSEKNSGSCPGSSVSSCRYIPRA